MSTHAQTPTRERAILLTLAVVQFTHIMDFMIMMPLGSHLMRVFAISPEQFSHLVAAYGLTAAVCGFGAGFFLDRIERKRALLTLYAGFGLATLACALAPTYGTLMAARAAAGAFGGVASSVLFAMVGDVIPAARRGRGMAVVGAAFPLALALAGDPAHSPARRFGLVYAVNTIGSVAGTLAAGFVLIPWLGLPTTLAAAASSTTSPHCSPISASRWRVASTATTRRAASSICSHPWARASVVSSCRRRRLARPR